MNCPFPGMDPYLEHRVLWESLHARLIVAIANQLQPKLDPRYGRRIRYDQPCEPPLPLDDQTWANQQIATFR
jgi:hypothetical protein